MRVVCLVPSWTETLLESGVDVVGRTRFCLFPRPHVAGIPAVGGTKDCDWEKVRALRPDLLLLDREENPKWMSDEAPCPWHATHVRSVSNMPGELKTLAGRLQNQALEKMAERWEKILQLKPISFAESQTPPALMEWGRRMDSPPEEILYLIWRNPWMAVGRDTFIGSVLERFGIMLSQFEKRYPELDLNAYDPKKTLLLLSSEPYPFHKIKSQLRPLPFPYAFVKGDLLSWFGVRTLRFLESETEIAPDRVKR